MWDQWPAGHGPWLLAATDCDPLSLGAGQADGHWDVPRWEHAPLRPRHRGSFMARPSRGRWDWTPACRGWCVGHPSTAPEHKAHPLLQGSPRRPTAPVGPSVLWAAGGARPSPAGPRGTEPSRPRTPSDSPGLCLCHTPRPSPSRWSCQCDNAVQCCYRSHMSVVNVNGRNMVNMDTFSFQM